MARLGLGTVQFGLPYGIANAGAVPDEDEIGTILALACEAGLALLDTSPVYGSSEERLGRLMSLRGLRLPISTKLPSLSEAHDRIHGFRLKDAVRDACVGSLTRLKVDRVELYLAHDERDVRVFGDDLWEAFARLQEEGLVGRFGASWYDPALAESTLSRRDIRAAQVPFNLLDKRFLSYLGQQNPGAFTAVARSVFLQGLFSLPPEQVEPRLPEAVGPLRRLHEVAASLGTPLMDLALRHALSQVGLDVVIVGVISRHQLQENLEVMAGPPIPLEWSNLLNQAIGEVPVKVVNPSLWGAP